VTRRLRQAAATAARRKRETEVTMRERRGFLGFTLLAAMAAVTSAAAQTAPFPAAQAHGGTQSAVSVPDLSGAWVYPFCCGFSPPLSGQGPVVNRVRRAQTYGANGLALPATPRPAQSSNTSQYVGDYTNPILKPQAAAIVKKHGEVELSGTPYPTPRNQCWPEGVPFILANMGIELIQQPDTVTILYEHDHQVRHVRMNQPHPARVTPSWYGDSVGHYEGDALIVDTVGIKIGPYSMIDWYGTPYSQALHVVERYRLIDHEAVLAGDERAASENRRMPSHASGATGLAPAPDYKGAGLQLEFTVDDEGVFTVPWSASITYWRSFGEWPEHVCAENLRSTFVVSDSAAPRADRPDF
jgi:hypothetical protein